MSKKKHILVLAYMLSPYKGSEFSVAWNYVTEMSKDNNLTVLYGISGKHMGDCEEMETFIKDNPISGVNLIAIKPNRIANALNFLNKHDIFVYTFYYAYKVWQKLAYHKALELMKSNHFDLVHYVGMIGYREPGYLRKTETIVPKFCQHAAIQVQQSAKRCIEIYGHTIDGNK